MQSSFMPIHPRHARAATWTLAGLLATGCATYTPQAGGTREAVQQAWGTPTSVYAMADGVQRLEYASGPYGRTTWMVDVAPDGRVMQARQVLNEAEFLAVQTQAARGMTRDELLRRLGRPGERKHGGYQGGEVWSWRYPTNDCLWFQFSVSDSGRAYAGAYNVDPMCDAPSDGRN